MKIIIQRTGRRKTENGYYFNEEPQIINVCHKFPGCKKSEGCGCPKTTGRQHKLHVATVPFGKHYSECEKKLNDCIPENALTYKTGKYSEIPRGCEECKRSR